jgi:hypothetical protein
MIVKPDRLVRLAGPLFLFLALGMLLACGKKGPPVPQEQRNMFAWEETDADFSGDCLVLAGRLKGAYENASTFSLELEATTEGICLDCPFRPGEFLDLEPGSAQGGLFSFQHCPAEPADAYRWRLIARSVFQSLPNAVSPVNLVRRPF